MKFYKYFILFTLIICSLNLYAQDWRRLGKNDTGEYFYDFSSIIGESTDRKINIKTNLANETKDGVRSRLTQLSIDCVKKTYALEVIKTYDLQDLTGLEKISINKSPKSFEATPKTLGEAYVNAACSNISNVSSSNVSAQIQSNQKTEIKERLQLFGKSNAEKNLEEAFSNVLTPDQKNEIAWNFIFANSIHLKLTKGSDWQKQAPNYASLIPMMREGVDLYLAAFDSLASVLGVSRSDVMRALNISLNDFGLAKFITGQNNNNIEAQTNIYIWYFDQPLKKCSFFDEECHKAESRRQSEKVYLARDLNPYYVQRPPQQLFGKSLRDDIAIMERYFQRVIDSANKIESRLLAQEVERQRQQREAAIRQEEERKRLAELSRQRAEEEKRHREFLDSPEGKRQLAAQREAERQRQLSHAKEFPFYAVISCGSNYGEGSMPAFICFNDGGVDTNLEIRNGDAYRMYTFLEMTQMQPGKNLNMEINLRQNFEIKMQNAHKNAILNLKIYSATDRRLVYEKSAARFDIIRIFNK